MLHVLGDDLVDGTEQRLLAAVPHGFGGSVGFAVNQLLDGGDSLGFLVLQELDLGGDGVGRFQDGRFAELGHQLAGRQQLEFAELGALHHFGDDGRDGLRLRQTDASVGQVGVGVDGRTGVEADQLFHGLGVGRRHVDDGVQATGAQQGRVDRQQVVGRDHRDDVGVLGVDAVQDVEDVVHLDAAVTVDGAVDVFAEDDAGRRLVLLGELDGVGQLVGAGDVDVGDAVVDGQTRGDGRRQGLARAVGATQQDAALDGHAVQQAVLDTADRREQVGFDGVLDFLGVDQAVRVDAGRVQERGLGHLEQVAVVVAETDLDRLALVDRVFLEVGADVVEQAAHFTLVEAQDVGAQAEDPAALLLLDTGLDVALDVGQREAAPGGFGELVRRDLDAQHFGRVLAEEARRRDGLRPAVLLGQDLLQSVGAIQREHFEAVAERGFFLLVLQAAVQQVDGLGEGHAFRQDELFAHVDDVGHRDLLFDLG